MEYPDEILKKVKTYSSLGYSISDLVKLIRPENPEQFINDINDENHDLNIIYTNGILSGKSSISVQEILLGEISVKIKQAELNQLESENRIYKELFNL